MNNQFHPNSNRLALPKIDEAAEEEEATESFHWQTSAAAKVKTVKKVPVIQMNKTALLRANRLREMKTAAETSQQLKASKMPSQRVKENATATNTAAAEHRTGLKKSLVCSSNTTTRLANINVLTAINLHASKFNRN